MHKMEKNSDEEFTRTTASNSNNMHIYVDHRQSTLGTWAFSVAGPMVWNSVPDSLGDPAVESERVSAGLENASLPSDIRDMSALEMSPFHVIALYKSKFTYLVTYVEHAKYHRHIHTHTHTNPRFLISSNQARWAVWTGSYTELTVPSRGPEQDSLCSCTQLSH